MVERTPQNSAFRKPQNKKQPPETHATSLRAKAFDLDLSHPDPEPRSPRDIESQTCLRQALWQGVRTFAGHGLADTDLDGQSSGVANWDREDGRIRPYLPVTFDPTLLWLQKPCQHGSVKLQFHDMATGNAPVTFDPTLLWAQKSVPNGSTMFQFHGRATRNAPVTFDPTLRWAQATWPTGKEMAASSSNSTTWPRETRRSHLTLPYFGLKNQCQMAVLCSNSTAGPRETHRSHLTLPYVGLKQHGQLAKKWQHQAPIPRHGHAKRAGHI